MKLPFVFRVQSERQNNYTMMQQGPECATMTRELCLEAENIYTPEMEGVFFLLFLVDEHKVHGLLGKQGETTRCTERKPKQRRKKQSHEILM